MPEAPQDFGQADRAIVSMMGIMPIGAIAMWAEMPQYELPLVVQQWANDVLVWVGFGTIVGLLAKAIMPGRDPGGPIATLAMGVGGTIIGCGLWSFFQTGSRVTPISPMGFVVGTAGAFVILCFYKILGGYWFTEVGTARRAVGRPHIARRRRDVVVDDH
ncbi:MAG: GlsB/YeaQ/YmgE family stress response membrane protein [Planctomycetaceae bacterium]